MADEKQWFFGKLVAFSIVVKLLLLPTYRSTDFEVHRNWLAITHSLPISQWYYEETSQWTLDYPPFFAWFEFLLSHFAFWLDPEMTKVENLEYSSFKTIVFQRLSVVTADMMLIYACYQYYCSYANKKLRCESENLTKAQLICVLLVLNFGLIILDHIHFQYNGFLFGILILSITRMFEDEFLWSAFWFSVLLNFKHIYLYIAPAYFVYLLKRYCFKEQNSSLKNHWFGVNIWDFLPLRLLKLACLVIIVFAASLGPFIAMGQIQQLLIRLFPFKRGLCHAYWAPNFWALYNVLDKVLGTAGSKLGLTNAANMASMTGGLIGQFQHAVLPSVLPLATLVMTFLAMMPCLINLWIKPSDFKRFLKALVLCAYCSYLFGWHVHEKAVLLITIPLSLLALESHVYGRIFIIVSTSGNVSLFPLLFQRAETPIKVVLMLLYTLFMFWAFAKVLCSPSAKQRRPLLHRYEKFYLSGLVVLEIYNLFVHESLGLGVKFPFLPLLLTSVYCAVGIMWSWMLFYYAALTEHHKVATE